MRPQTRMLMCLLFVVCVAGCTRTMTEQQLRAIARSTGGDTMGAVYYKGRKGGYDYFYVQWNVGSRTYRIPDRNWIVRIPMPYTSRTAEWVDRRELMWLPVDEHGPPLVPWIEILTKPHTPEQKPIRIIPIR